MHGEGVAGLGTLDDDRAGLRVEVVAEDFAGLGVCRRQAPLEGVLGVEGDGFAGGDLRQGFVVLAHDVWVGGAGPNLLHDGLRVVHLWTLWRWEGRRGPP